MSSPMPPGQPIVAMRGKLFREYLTQPLHVTLLAGFCYLFGTFRQKVAFDLVRRRQTAYGLLQAADWAKELGLDAITAIEVGVASGAGLWNLITVGERVSRETGVRIEVVGFDTGTGLPPPIDHRDHPEVWQGGDFAMGDGEALRRSLPANARLILGDVAETVPRFVAELRAETPIGYVAMDVDYYSSAKHAMQLFLGLPEMYLPVTIVYFDDVGGFPGANDWCGERLAIREFNEEQPLRKIQRDEFLRYRRVYKDSDWIERIYHLHVLDHPIRRGTRRVARPAYRA